MAFLEELSDDEGGCCLEENPGGGGGASDEDCLLEDNPGDPSSLSLDGPTLEAQPDPTGDADDSGSSDEEWEIPFSASGEAAPATAQEIEVRLPLKAGERLGLVLDAGNVVVALRPDTVAARSNEILVGDRVLAVQGEPCSAERRVAQLLRDLPQAAVYVLTLERALEAELHTAWHTRHIMEHGPLPTPEEEREQAARSLEERAQLREQLPEEYHKEMGLEPQNLAESKFVSGRPGGGVEDLDPIKRKAMQDMWYRQARGKLEGRLSAAEMLRGEGNDKFSAGEYAEALEEYEYALDLFKYEIANLCRDQRGAELGDLGRGLGSDDLPAIQKERVPCLLNSAACHVKLGGRAHLVKALSCTAGTVDGLGGATRPTCRPVYPPVHPRRSTSARLPLKGAAGALPQVLRRGASGDAARQGPCQGVLPAGAGRVRTRQLPRGVGGTGLRAGARSRVTYDLGEFYIGRRALLCRSSTLPRARCARCRPRCRTSSSSSRWPSASRARG